MLEDGYGNRVTTRSDAARAAYVEGCDRLLRLWPGGAAMLERAVSADPGFALAQVALARARQLAGDPPGARSAMAAAQAARVATEREPTTSPCSTG